MAHIVAVCVSDEKGTKKVDRGRAMLVAERGVDGDAHAGAWHRQVSLLSVASINSMRERGADVGPGDFAENLTVDGLTLHTLPVGTRLRVGGTLLEVTQIGKECHHGCAIFQQVGDCVMPREGIFARVLRGGPVERGDAVEVEKRTMRAGVLTASDTRPVRQDVSGARAAELLAQAGFRVAAHQVVADDAEAIACVLRRWSDAEGFDLIVTTGGTGLGPRDVTPEATLAVAERLVPGLGEAMRAAGMAQTRRAMLSRAVAVLRGRTLIVNLPGSPAGVQESLAAILDQLPHGIEMLAGGGHTNAEAP